MPAPVTVTEPETGTESFGTSCAGPPITEAGTEETRKGTTGATCADSDLLQLAHDGQTRGWCYGSAPKMLL